MVRGEGGRQQVIHVEGAGGTLGEIPLFRGHRHPATAISVREGLCRVVPLGVVEQAIGADPRLALLLLDRLADREALERVARGDHPPRRPSIHASTL